jgi:hypothetical protein
MLLEDEEIVFNAETPTNGETGHPHVYLYRGVVSPLRLGMSITGGDDHRTDTPIGKNF